MLICSQAGKSWKAIVSGFDHECIGVFACARLDITGLVMVHYPTPDEESAFITKPTLDLGKINAVI